MTEYGAEESGEQRAESGEQTAEGGMEGFKPTKTTTRTI